jgi:hypothetical protein
MFRTYTTGGKVTHHPLGVTITLLLVGEHGLVGVAESEVQGLGREVTDDVGSVTSPERDNTLIGSGTLEAVGDTGVLVRKTASLKHLILVLDEELDALNGGSSGLRDGGGNTTHQEVDNEALWRLSVSCAEGQISLPVRAVRTRRVRLHRNPSGDDQCIDSFELGELVACRSDLSKILLPRYVKCGAGSTNPHNKRQMGGGTYGHAENALISLVCHFDIFLNEIKTKREERMEKGKKLDGRRSFK